MEKRSIGEKWREFEAGGPDPITEVKVRGGDKLHIYGKQTISMNDKSVIIEHTSGKWTAQLVADDGTREITGRDYDKLFAEAMAFLKLPPPPERKG